MMPFVETGGNGGAVAPVQIVSDVPKSKTGVMVGVTVTVNVVVVAHSSAAGVNV